MAIEAFRWSIVTAPAGFDMPFQPDSSAPEAQIQLILAGDYTFALTTVDANGRESCEQGFVDVHVE